VVGIKIIAGGVLAGILSNITGYLITGRLFHGYQARTPNTWRTSESWNLYLYSAGVRVLSSLAIALLYSVIGARTTALIGGAISSGATFGCWLWAAAAAPVILEIALFVNWHRGFVVGLLLDWLTLCVIASTVASVVQHAI
jgi:Na+/melibiose symporter-like transporter